MKELKLSRENQVALEMLLGKEITKETSRKDVVMNCGGCTSLHHNN